MIRRLSLFLALLASASAAVPEPTSVVAEHSETSMRTGETILTGHPRADYGDVRLAADEIRINPRTRIAVATGHAVLTQGPRRLLADVITYHAADGTFEVGDLRVGEFPVYVSGSSASGTADALIINDARITVPEPGLLVPTLQAARLFFNAGHNVHAQRASFGLGNIRPFSLHGVERDVRAPLIPYVVLNGGYRNSLGVYVEAGLQLPVSANLHLGGDLGLYSRRGVMAGPSGSYKSTAPGADFTGSFSSGFIHDYGTRYNDILGQPVPADRGFVEWTHRQNVTDRLTVNGQLNYWSDSEVVRDFRPSDFFPVQQPDSYLESDYTGRNFFISLFARFAPNAFQSVQERLPELRFDLLPLPVGGGFYQRFNASVAVLRETPPTSASVSTVTVTDIYNLGGQTAPSAPYRAPPASGSIDTSILLGGEALARQPNSSSLALLPPHPLRSTRFDAYYALTRPLRPSEWLAFTPVAGARLTHYTDLDGARNDYTRTLGELGFDAELHASGTYDYKNSRWKIDGLRHLLTPRLSYRYIPEADKGAAYIPAIDRRSFSTYLQPLGLGDQRNIDDLHATHTLRLGFDNTLQTRDAVYGSRDLVTFNVANDFRFKRAPGERDVSAIHTELAVMPARWLELGVYQSFTPQDLQLQEFNTGITLRDGDQWTARLSSNFLRHELEDYFLEGRRRINELFEAVAHLRYNARLHRFDEQAYGLRQNIGNTWSVEYVVTLYDGPRRESRFGFNVRIDAVRF